MSPDRGGGIPAISGRTGLYLFAFSLWLSTAGAYIGLGLMLFAAVADRAARTALRRDAMIRLALLFAALLLLHTLWAAWTTAESLGMLWDDAWKWLRLFLFYILVAWWLAGEEARIGRALLLALAGLLLRMLLDVQESGWSVLWSEMRSGFGLPVLSFGLFCATALLGLLVLAPRWWDGPAQIRKRPGTVARVLAWCLVVVMVLQGLIVSQSRDAWISALIVIPLILVLRLAIAMRAGSARARLRAGAAFCLVLALIGAVAARNLDTITERAHSERSAWQALLSGDFDRIPDSSIGYRIQLIEYGLHKWLERPLLGWGTHSYRTLIAQTDDAELRALPHLHNAYIETLMTLGIVGAAFFLYFLGRLCIILYRSWRAGRMATDYALFLSGALGLQLIWCLANFGLNQVAWNFYFAMLAGTIYSYAIRTRGGHTMENPAV